KTIRALYINLIYLFSRYVLLLSIFCCFNTGLIVRIMTTIYRLFALNIFTVLFRLCSHILEMPCLMVFNILILPFLECVSIAFVLFNIYSYFIQTKLFAFWSHYSVITFYKFRNFVVTTLNTSIIILIKEIFDSNHHINRLIRCINYVIYLFKQIR